MDSPSPGRTGNSLNAVAAIAPDDVWAVGSVQDPYGSPALALHWDGSAWARVPSIAPPLATGTILTGVAAVSKSEVWAVGYATNGSEIIPLTQRWNGTRWAAMPTPDPGLNAELFAVTVTGGHVWAVGAYTNSGLHYGSLQNPLTFVLRR